MREGEWHGVAPCSLADLINKWGQLTHNCFGQVAAVLHFGFNCALWQNAGKIDLKSALANNIW